MYKCKYFKIHELVPPELYKKYKDEEHRLWLLFDDRVLRTADALREKFGSAVVNDWYNGGNFSQSGLRTKESESYSETSQHTYGRALDLKFKGVDPQKIRDYIIDNPVEFYYIKGIEDFDKMSWVHIDVRNEDAMKVFSK